MSSDERDEDPAVSARAQRLRVERRDEALGRWGTRSWFALGVVAALAVVFSALSAVSGLVVPLIVATAGLIVCTRTVRAMRR